jgi:methyl-accepting chemotaxis protein
MTWFSQLSLQKKLISIFVLSALLTTAVSYSGLLTTKQIANNTMTTYEKDVIPLEYINDISLAFLSVRVDLRDAIFCMMRGDMERMKMFHERAMKNVARVEQRSKMYQERLHTEEGKQLFSEYMLALEEFKRVGVKVVSLTQSQQHDAVVQAILTECIPSAEKVKNYIERVVIQKQTVARRINEENIVLLNQATMLYNSMIFVGFALIIGLGVWLATSISRKIGRSVEATANSSAMISSSVNQLSAGIRTQSLQATEIVSAVEQMAATIAENTRQTSLAAREASETSTAARHGGAVVKQTIDGMSSIASAVLGSAQTMTGLVKSSTEIEKITQVIDEIADQTNLLALNAAIEAARAGDHGRGFAVVADEVRRLAERTRKATREIGTMIHQMQDSTKDVMEAMNKGRDKAESGRELAEQAAVALQQIIMRTENVSDIISRLAVASEEQSAASNEIAKSVNVITSIIEESAAGVRQIVESVENLHHLTDNLQTLVNRSKMESALYQMQRYSVASSTNGGIHPATIALPRHGSNGTHHHR